MAFNVIWAVIAGEELDHHLDGFDEAGKPHKKVKLLDDLDELSQILENNPYAFTIWEKDVHKVPLNVLYKFPYTLFYKVNDDKGIVTIIGLLHQKQDNSKIINR